MAKDRFRLKRKQDGFVTDFLTEEQASKLAGYPEDFDKVEEPKPIGSKIKDNRQNLPDEKPAAGSAAEPPAGDSKGK